MQGEENPLLVADSFQLASELGSAAMAVPQRKDAVGLGNDSRVLSTPLRCYPNSPIEFHSLVVRLQTQALCPTPCSSLAVG